MKSLIYLLSLLLCCIVSPSALAAKVAVIYHSGYGHTEVIAQAIYNGALELKGTEAELIKVSPQGKIPEGGWQALERSDAIVFGAPTYMGSLSALQNFYGRNI